MARQLTNFVINDKGNLEISLTEEGKEEAQEYLDKLENDPNANYYSLWWDLNEYHFCNGYYDAQDKLALWGGPAITDAHLDDDLTDEQMDEIKVWQFLDYAVVDELREVLNGETITFTLTQTGEEEREHEKVPFENSNAGCVVDSHHGIYVGQTFAEKYKDDLLRNGYDQDDLNVLLAGPNNELYLDVWSELLPREIKDEDGKSFTFFENDGDVFELPTKEYNEIDWDAIQN